MFGLNRNNNETSFTLDLNAYFELSNFSDTNSTVKQCIGILDRFLFQSVRINNAKKLLNVYLDKYFLPFFRQMLKNIIILGWCPYITKKIKDPISKLPIIVPQMYPVEYIRSELVVDKVKLDYEFKFYDENNNVRKDIKVFMFSDLSELANEQLIHSLLSGLLAEQRYVTQIKKFTIQSEYVRSNPPVYLKKDHVSSSAQNTMQQTNAFRGGNQNDRRIIPNPANFDDRIQQPNDTIENAVNDTIKNVEFHQTQVHNLARMQQHNYYNLGLGFAPQWYNNLFICPPNMTLAANPHLPESRVDQLAMDKKLSSDIYLTFGIPESLLGYVGGFQQGIKGSANRSSNIRKDVNIMDVNGFESTLFRYQNFFQDCFVVLFHVIFKKHVNKDTVEFKPPKLYEQFIESILNEQLGADSQEIDTSRDKVDDEKSKRKTSEETKESKESKDSTGDKETKNIEKTAKDDDVDDTEEPVKKKRKKDKE